jgi:hypothetical protein
MHFKHQGAALSPGRAADSAAGARSGCGFWLLARVSAVVGGRNGAEKGQHHEYFHCSFHPFRLEPACRRRLMQILKANYVPTMSK